MIFNSILNLVQDYHEGVYKFICRIFYENYDDLDLDECQQIYSAINKIRGMENRDFDDFIGCFDSEGHLYTILNELRPGGEYGIFTSEEDFVISELEGASLVLVSDFLDIFSNEAGVKNDSRAVVCNASKKTEGVRFGW